MESVGIQSYSRTRGINPNPSKKTRICIQLHKGLRKGANIFLFYWDNFTEHQRYLLSPCMLGFCNNAEIISIHVTRPIPHTGHLSYEFAMFTRRYFSSSTFLGRLPVSHLHPRPFLPSTLLLWALCLCSHASHTPAAGLPPASAVWSQRQAQAQLQKRERGPL